MLVDRAALDRRTIPHRHDRGFKAGHAIDDEELGPPQATPDKIVEHRPPGFGALPAHGLDREEELLTVGAHTDND